MMKYHETIKKQKSQCTDTEKSLKKTWWKSKVKNYVFGMFPSYKNEGE